MAWIKLNYDRFLLALAALALAACAGLLLTRAQAFNTVFETLGKSVPEKNKIPHPDSEQVAKDSEKLGQPDTWHLRAVGDNALPVFVSTPYIAKIDVDGAGAPHETLINPLSQEGVPIHPPIPNRWFFDNKQEILAANALTQDSDGDGFNTFDEWQGKTNPNDKASHPPFITKLFLQQFKRIPFRFRFDALNGNTVFLNTLDVEEAPTQMLTVGKMVENTRDARYKLTDLKKKNAIVGGINKDVSEITLTNIDSGEKIIMVKEQEVDSPTTFAVMVYLLKGQPFQVRKNQEVTIPDEPTIKYKCTNLDQNEVTLLRLDTQKELKIGKQPPPPKG